MDPLVIQLIVLVILLILSAFFSSAETALSTVNKVRMRTLAEEGDVRAKRVLRIADDYGDYPCHRVVNHAGRLAPHFPGQRALLEAEGVAFLPSGHVDMARFRWDC